MNTFILLQVIITCFLGAASPGPSLVLISRNGIANGILSGTITGLGHAIGIFFYCMISIVGISLFFRINSKILDYLTLILVIYLIFIAIKILRSNSNIKQKIISKKLLTENFIEGFLICFFNPKITIFFFAIFSQFIKSETTIFQIFYLASIASIIDFLWYTFVSFSVGNSAIRKFLNKEKILNLSSSMILIGISLFIIYKLLIN